MYPIVVFSGAYERAGASIRYGEFSLAENLQRTEFRFEGNGWIRKNRTLKLNDRIIIDAGGNVQNYEGEKIGRISLSKKFLSYWNVDCEIFEKRFILRGVTVKD